MNTTYHSEYLKLQSVYIKSAKNAFVSQDSLNIQWKDLNYLELPEFDSAIKEYQVFEKIFTDNGIDLQYFPFDSSVKIDSIYCRDASIATDFGMIICNMGKGGRIE